MDAAAHIDAKGMIADLEFALRYVCGLGSTNLVLLHLSHEQFYAAVILQYHGWNEETVEAIVDVCLAARDLPLKAPPFSEGDDTKISEAIAKSNRLAMLVADLTGLQRIILEALDGKALTLERLEAELEMPRDTILGGRTRKGGLKELVALRRVIKRTKGGYYRPDAAPE
jgi:hypothetical protein